MQNNNPMPTGSMIEPNAQPAFAPAAPGAAPLNPGASLTSDGSLEAPVDKKNKTRGTLVETILLILMTIVAMVFIFLYVQKFIQWKTVSDNVETQINAAVAVAVADNTTKMEAEFAEREKYPYKTFTGPVDYGSFSFEYPQTWSVYIAKDAANGGDFEAYMNPTEVNPVGTNTINALRVRIRDTSFDNVVRTYENSVKNGKLTLKTDMVGGVLANVYTGEISNTLRGAVMVLKLRDKTVILQTDAETFVEEFYRILSTVSLVE